VLMEFRLVYDGPLRPNADVKVKHAIRRCFHPQLRRLWKEHQVLAHKWEVVPRVPPMMQPAMNILRQRGYINNVEGITEVEMLARDFSKCGFRFVPLVNKRFDLVCALNILFLRRGNPGDLVLPGGDIDNRIKTLLDALRVPDNCNELPPNCSPEQEEEPFFCLLQNDSLITDLNITTDRLITPDPQQDHRGHEVLLVIHVTLKATKITLENLQLIS
jgi:hypothetical protein